MLTLGNTFLEERLTMATMPTTNIITPSTINKIPKKRMRLNLDSTQNENGVLHTPAMANSSIMQDRTEVPLYPAIVVQSIV